LSEAPLPVQSPPVFVSAGFSKTHLELHHYTSFNGLRGIVQSDTLWASHYSELNDTTEVTHLREPFGRAAARRFLQTLSEKQRHSPRIRRAIRKSGGLEKSADDLARDLMNSTYKVTFEDHDEFSFGEPYIASFCSHAGDQPYEQNHGLLSQWRGYAGDGGFCIVFDTATFGALFVREWVENYWTHLNVDQARYATDDRDIDAAFSDILDLLNHFVECMIDGRSPPSMEAAFGPFISAATLFKHQGFREEREVRIVAIPSSRELRDRQLAEYPNLRIPPLKEVRTRTMNGQERRYIVFFGFEDAPLPIKRMIVGPSRHQEENYEFARALLGDRVEITQSETPFIGAN